MCVHIPKVDFALAIIYEVELLRTNCVILLPLLLLLLLLLSLLLCTPAPAPAPVSTKLF